MESAVMGDTGLFYFWEIDILCLILGAWMALRIKSGSGMETQNILFLKTDAMTAGLIFIEALQLFTDGRPGCFFYFFNILLNAGRYIQASLAACTWFMYTQRFLHPKRQITRLTNLLTGLPHLLLSALVLLSPWTGWIFRIDSGTNMLHLGPLVIVLRVVTYGYFAIAAHTVLVATLKEKDWNRRAKLIAVLSFIIFPITAGVLVALRPELQVAWQLTMLSLFFVFSELQFAQIFRDALTGINNRNAFNSYVHRLAAAEEQKGVYLFMMDVNKFKEINDQFGHPEGDWALEKAAQIITETFNEKASLIARYGGDEFVCFADVDEEAAHAMRERLYAAFRDYSAGSGRGYTLSMSLGFARLEGRGKAAVKDLIAQADSDLYREKQKAHKGVAE